MKTSKNLFLLENGEILNLFTILNAFEKNKHFFVAIFGKKQNLEISRQDFFKIQEICEFHSE